MGIKEDMAAVTLALQMALGVGGAAAADATPGKGPVPDTPPAPPKTSQFERQIVHRQIPENGLRTYTIRNDNTRGDEGDQFLDTKITAKDGSPVATHTTRFAKDGTLFEDRLAGQKEPRETQYVSPEGEVKLSQYHSDKSGRDVTYTSGVKGTSSMGFGNPEKGENYVAQFDAVGKVTGMEQRSITPDGKAARKPITPAERPELYEEARGLREEARQRAGDTIKDQTEIRDLEFKKAVEKLRAPTTGQTQGGNGAQNVTINDAHPLETPSSGKQSGQPQGRTFT